MHASFIDRLPFGFLKWGGASFLAVGVLIAGYIFASDPENFVYRKLAQYTAHLDRKLHLMFNFTPARRIVQGQIVAGFLVIAVGAFLNPPYWYLALPVVIFGPAIQIERKRRARIIAIEQQIDAFLLALANGLMATPSIGDAFASLQYLIAQPLRDEIQLAVKEMRIGATLDQAILNIAARVNSRSLDTAISAILTGRQVGGDLPSILTTIAAAMREMIRLDRMVRAKTANARTQFLVLMFTPPGLYWMIKGVQEDYFKPLDNSHIGYAVYFAVAVLWVGSAVIARKVLVVDV